MFQTLGLIAKQDDPRAGETCRALLAYLRRRGTAYLVDAGCAAAVPEASAFERTPDQIGRACDLVLVIGGDGTLLKAARLLVEHDVRLLGVNLGRVGFLTDVCRHEMEARLDEILSGRLQEEERFLLSTVVLRGGEEVIRHDALNDVVVQKLNVARLIQLDTYVDGQFVSSQRSDGVIIATPTGSTAYALSGGGPLLHPTLKAIVLVPICPHTLSYRPIVVDADSVVELVVTRGQRTTAQVTCDGDTVAELEVGDHVLTRKKPRGIRLIHPPGHDYYATLRTKLHWAREL
jgi:NAD+ kinase